MKLSEAIEIYVRKKRAEGLLFDLGSKTLGKFCDQIGDLSLGEVKTQHVSAFLDRFRAVNSSRVNHGLLRRFFEYWVARDAIAPLPLPSNRQPGQQWFIPHIYTREEIRKLLRTIPKCQSDRSCVLDQRTVRCAILLLYATGARVGEIASLKVRDVDAKRGYISIFGGRFGRSRKIPIGRDLRTILKSYLSFRQQKHPTNDQLFLTQGGEPATARKIRMRFQRLRVLADIQNTNLNGGRPRMNDFRASFAVHRIASWIKSGDDLNRMLPALAAYMGLVGLTATERYIALTPERFRKELNKLSPERINWHWREDAQLMKFLAAL